MKKFLLVAVAAGFALSFGSCKKDYTCTCTVTVSGSTTPQTITIPLSKTTKKDAQKNCDAAKTTYTSAASTANCGL